MITLSELSVQTINTSICWQEQLVNAISSPADLLNILKLDRNLLSPALKAGKKFSMKVPYSFVRRMELGNEKDPLLKQVLPIGEECTESEGYSLDPLSERSMNPKKGLIHKYHGRVLFVTSGACAVNCRFCFRRHFPYQDNSLGGKQWNKALDYVRANSSIREVIFSGGDPLVVNDKSLYKMINSISAIGHITTLRIHTRLPVVIPQRITPSLVDMLTETRLKPVMVIHCNHPNEINCEVSESTHSLRNGGVTLLNQTVLLHGINDKAEIIVDLSHKLFDAGVLPYYLHLLDKVQGAAHFDVTETNARSIMKQVMASCPGYLVPKLVKEIPGETGKTWIL